MYIHRTFLLISPSFHHRTLHTIFIAYIGLRCLWRPVYIIFLLHFWRIVVITRARYLKMAEEGGTSKFQPKKKKKYLIKFKTRQDQSSVDYPFLKTSKRGENYAHCTICNTNFCIEHGGENDVKRHISLNKHIEAVSALNSTQRLFNFFPGNSANATLDEKVLKAELLFTGFLCEHNLPIATAEHSIRLFKIMFLDSKIAQTYACGRTKTTYVLCGTVAKEFVDNLKTL